MSAVADGVGCGVWAVRACGARARERAESSGAERATERREAGDSGAERGEGTGQRERAAERAQGRETASPMVLHCGILWERR